MEKTTLFVNACVRKESRTKALADQLLRKLGGPYEEIRLMDIPFPAVNEEFLAKRDRLISAGCFQDAMFAPARQFAEAETIVIAAPYWDLSFPAMLKQYLEQINVVGITFRYTEEGVPAVFSFRRNSASDTSGPWPRISTAFRISGRSGPSVWISTVPMPEKS